MTATMSWALLALFLALQLADAITTAIVLRSGGRELNPAMAWLMRATGVRAALAIKVLVVGAAGVGAALHAPAMLIVLCTAYSFVVIHNWRQIG